MPKDTLDNDKLSRNESRESAVTSSIPGNDAWIQSFIDEYLPCIDQYCDGHGNTVDGSPDDPYPSQCQYCYMTRLPAKSTIQQHLKQAEAKARIKLPTPYLQEQMLGHSKDDKSYMEGFNRCLEDIKLMNNASLQQQLNKGDKES